MQLIDVAAHKIHKKNCVYTCQICSKEFKKNWSFSLHKHIGGTVWINIYLFNIDKKPFLRLIYRYYMFVICSFPIIKEIGLSIAMHEKFPRYKKRLTLTLERISNNIYDLWIRPFCICKHCQGYSSLTPLISCWRSIGRLAKSGQLYKWNNKAGCGQWYILQFTVWSVWYADILVCFFDSQD